MTSLHQKAVSRSTLFPRRAALPLAALATFLVTGELLARVFGVVDRLNGYNRLLFTRGSSDEVPYRLRPGAETTFLGTPVRVNRLGFRGPEYATTAPSLVRVHRVLLLGDSVAFGLGVGEQDTLSSVLQRHLGERTGTLHEVINGGIPGFDAVASVRLLEAVGAELRPDAVVFAMSLNDYEPAARYGPLGILTRRPQSTGPASWIERSEFALLLRWLAGYARGMLAFQRHERLARARESAVRDDSHATVAHIVQKQHLRFYRSPHPVLWQRIVGAFHDLRRLTGERDAVVLVAIFPEAYQITAIEPDLTPQRRLLDACRQAGLRCLDLRPAFATAGGNSFADVQHPNAQGLAVAGAAIAEALIANEGLGEPLAAGE